MILDKVILVDYIHSHTATGTTTIFLIYKTMVSLENSSPEVVQAQADMLCEMQLAG